MLLQNCILASAMSSANAIVTRASEETEDHDYVCNICDKFCFKMKNDLHMNTQIIYHRDGR
ncbi:hypothetical protein X777_06546 [Ooceraea biroi]|uniref:C2H2-type domain-containing protein n=1 Tax=Ooceraea biroi TaxID=2015173 RepID=A0A026WBN1_OOCBI|nr:hypothetical protein X777_06546 [Ooceraea biroi]